MHKQSANTNNKSIDWNYLPDEQLADVVLKYPFYTKANVEVVKRSHNHANQNLSALKDKTTLYVTDVRLFNHINAINNKITDDIDNAMDISNESDVKDDQLISDNTVSTEVSSPKISLSEEHMVPVEPLYTVDYFLSQGIRVTDDTVSNDKLGTQLKSFTDWLKSMKKLHTQKLEPLSENTDKIIQSIAEHSNEAAGVETEAMAEVLIRQGKRLQALDIYQKLSLKNPSESAYFAAKIKSLKQA
jgi:hypothetical protein